MSPVIVKVSNPRHRKRVAIFDFDWTLVKPKTGGTFPKHADDWVWLYPCVPTTLQEYYRRGYAIVVCTNQSKPWKQEQIERVMQSLDIPCTIVIAFDKTEYKPNTVMMEHVFADKEWDRTSSFFVGDALGRPTDFADSDRKFAEALNIRFYAPEDFFDVKK